MDAENSPQLKSQIEYLLLKHPLISSKKALADKIGVEQTTVSNWLSRNTRTPEVLKNVAEAFGIPLVWLDWLDNEFKPAVDQHFAGAKILSTRAQESDLIGLWVWGGGEPRLIGGRSQVGSIGGTQQFGIGPRSRATELALPQHTRVALDLDLDAIRMDLNLRAGEVLVFSEDTKETVCLRPSQYSRGTLNSAPARLLIPSTTDIKKRGAPAEDDFIASTLGDMALIVVLISQAAAESDAHRALMYELEACDSKPCSPTLLRRVVDVHDRAKWLKRKLLVTTA